MSKQSLKQKSEKLEEKAIWRSIKVLYVLASILILLSYIGWGLDAIESCRRTHTVQQSSRLGIRGQERRIAEENTCNVALESVGTVIGLFAIGGTMYLIYRHPLKHLAYYIVIGKA